MSVTQVDIDNATPADPAEAIRLKIRRLEALDKLAARAARGEFDDAVAVHEAAKAARRAVLG